MKTAKCYLLLLLIITISVSCKNKVEPEIKTVNIEPETTKTTDPNASFAKAEFTIDGMTCAIGCAATIQKKISKINGVKSASVDFDKKLAMVEYNDAKVTPKLLAEAVTNVSNTYTVSNIKTVETFSTTKTCANNCTKPCCTNKTEAEKANCMANCEKACCTNKTEKECADNCTKPCCTSNKA